MLSLHVHEAGNSFNFFYIITNKEYKHKELTQYIELSKTLEKIISKSCFSAKIIILRFQFKNSQGQDH